MDKRRIDTPSRMPARGAARRRIVGGLGGTLLGLLALPSLAPAACKKAGRRCDRNADCCDHATCKQEECACKNSFKACDGRCVDLAKDEQHCGRCDKTCAGFETCCGGGCVDVKADADNCGACGSECEASELCDDGSCRERVPV